MGLCRDSSAMLLSGFVFAAILGTTRTMIAPDLSPSMAYVDGQGRYQGLVIAINYKMSYTTISESSYLKNIETELKFLSKQLHETVGLQFGNVTILVPSYWSPTSYRTAFNEAPESADILIQPLDSATAYTRHIQGCGKQGLRLVVNAGYLQSSGKRSTENTRVLLHQWMHSRYGVFDEHPLKQAGAAHVDKQKFYHSSDKKIEAVRCSLELEAKTACKITEEFGYKDIDPRTSVPKEVCSFRVASPSKPSISLMSNFELENVDRICDKTSHNNEAPSQHNRLCGGKSITEVISQHKDFNKFGLSRRPWQNYAPPEFIIKKLRLSRTVVFVLDTSDSMNGTRLYLAKQAIVSMIANILEDNVKILIVKFDQRAAQLYPTNSVHNLGELNSDEARKEAIASLSDIQTGHHTCIGCGLRFAFEKLRNHSGTVSGAFFILLTDGADTKVAKSDLEETFAKSQKESFFIDTILLSDEADNRLIGLARKSASTIFSAVDYSSSLIDAFTEIVTNRQNLTGQVVQIFSKDNKAVPKQGHKGKFIVERHLIRGSKVTFYWNVTAQPHLSFNVKRVSDGKLLINEAATNHESGQLSASLTDDAEEEEDEEEEDGRSIGYEYEILNNHAAIPFFVTVTVNTRPMDKRETRLKRDISDSIADDYEQEYGMEAFVKSKSNFTFTSDGDVPEVSIHAYLPPGSTPDTPYNVTATITVNGINTNSADEFYIQLMDTGTGADVISNDRIHSAYFSHFMAYNATYYVRVRAEGQGFMRYASTGYFAVYIERNLNVPATLPPAPINDLQVMAVNQTQVMLRFTATGADLSFRKANHYMLWYSDDYDKVRSDSSVSASAQSKRLPDQPKSPGTTELIHVELPPSMMSANQTLWLALTAVDEYKLESNISNMVSVRYLGLQVSPPNSITKTDAPTMGTIIEGLDNLYFFIILGVIALLLLIILIMLIVLCCRRNRKRDKIDEKPFSTPYLGYDKSAYGVDIDKDNFTSDLAFQDTLDVSNDKINTYIRKPLPSTKTRVKSIFRTLSRKQPSSTKKEAPPPPADGDMQREEPIIPTVAPIVARIQPVPRQPTDYVTTERQNAKPLVVDTDTMAKDIDWASNVAEEVVRQDSQPECGNDVQL